MIAVGRMPIMRRNKTVGNLFFWIGLMMGFPFLYVIPSVSGQVIADKQGCLLSTILI
jgi:hypothetical protein